MSYWKTITSFVKNVLHRDDDYALCKVYHEDCLKCPKKDTCKKASYPSSNLPDSLHDLLHSTSSNSKNGSDNFVFKRNEQKLLIKFGAAYIEINGKDGIVEIGGTTVRINGNLVPKNGASGVITLFNQTFVQNGIIIGGTGMVKVPEFEESSEQTKKSSGDDILTRLSKLTSRGKNHQIKE